jgi:cytochrome c-type biogenesis protein CcmH/NrfG
MKSNRVSEIPSTAWTSGQVYTLAVICLVCGILLGYLFRGSSPAGPAPSVAAAAPATAAMPSVAETAAPLLDAVKRDPGNFDALTKLGNLYYDQQQYQQAVEYYGKALEVRPDTIPVRSDMGTAYWYLGDAKRAVEEFDKVLKLDPKHPQTLFNLGIVKWKGLKDSKGAAATWKKMLELNPDYPQKAQVEALIKHAESNGKDVPQ